MKPTFQFGDVLVDGEQRIVSRAGQEEKLRSQAFDVLMYLLEREQRAIAKEELLEAIWGRSWVHGTALSHCISEIRRAIGDDVVSPRYIETLPKHGYRFIGRLRVAPSIAGTSWSSTPTEGHSFGGTITGTGFVPGIRVFFCVGGTNNCHEQPQAGIAVTDAATLEVSNVNLPPGSYQIYVATSAGSSSRSAAFTVVEARSPAPTRSEEHLVERWHLIVSSCSYALLYVVALFLETAYEWPSYSMIVTMASPLVFLFAAIAAYRAYSWVGRSPPSAFNWSKGLSLYGLSALLLTAAVVQILPDQPVTQASIPTQSAQMAYWKDMLYFLFLGACFQFLPVGLIRYLGASPSQNRMSGNLAAVILRRDSTNPVKLVILLAICLFPFLLFVALLISTYFGLDHLRSNLITTPYSDLFEFFLWSRWGLFIFLAMESLTWFYWSLLKLASSRD